MKPILLGILAFITVSVTGCVTPPLMMNQLQSLQRGQSQNTTDTLLGRKPEMVANTVLDGHHYLAKSYPMQTGTETMTTVSCGPYGCIPISVPVPVTAPYLFIFENERLWQWGYIEELSKSDVPQVVKVVSQLKPLLAAPSSSSAPATTKTKPENHK